MADDTPPDPRKAEIAKRMIDKAAQTLHPLYEDDGVDDGDLELWRGSRPADYTPPDPDDVTPCPFANDNKGE